MNDALAALAEHDEAAVRAQHAVASPPSLGALEAASAELAALGAEKRALDVSRTPLQARAAELERDGAQARARAATIEARLAAATGAGRELEAMAHERDALRARADATDDELLEVLSALEPLDDHDVRLRSRAQEVAERRASLESAVAEERARGSAEAAALAASRPDLAAAVEPALLARYEAVAARRGGVGAARLIDGRCQACHVAVPSVLADHLAHDPDAVEVCEECGRLLVR